MVSVSKKYVKIEDLTPTIKELLKDYSKLRVEYPSDVENHFLVKAWKRKPKVNPLEAGNRLAPSEGQKATKTQIRKQCSEKKGERKN